jgi:prepilin-type processing-associated H-X9-DG protein
MTTQDFARSGTGSFVTGVAYNDTNGNQFYSVGEGKGAIMVKLLSGASVLASTSTWASGGYALKTTATGQLTVQFSGGGLPAPLSASIAMGSVNTKVDVVNGNTIQSSVTTSLLGSNGNLTLLGINSTDATGNAGSNTLTGNKGANKLNGLDGNDVLRGANGADQLNGGRGTDTLMGGTGSDKFIFSALSGNDRVTDFQDGIDKISFQKGAGFDFSDLSISGNGSNSVNVGFADGSIVVAGSSPITLTSSDFEFLA